MVDLGGAPGPCSRWMFMSDADAVFELSEAFCEPAGGGFDFGGHVLGAEVVDGGGDWRELGLDHLVAFGDGVVEDIAATFVLLHPPSSLPPRGARCGGTPVGVARRLLGVGRGPYGATDGCVLPRPFASEQLGPVVFERAELAV